MKHALIHIFLTGWIVFTVISACNLSSRIKHKDTEVDVTQTDQPCTLTLTARNNKQVVVVMYDVRPDCIEKATIAIYDGRSTSSGILTKNCSAYPWSYASRSHSLTLTPVHGKQLRPFSLDIHAIDTVKNFTASTGLIKSVRFSGYTSKDGYVLTTPNNFQAFYNINSDENVTISVFFKELYVETTTEKPGEPKRDCTDYVIVHGPIPSGKLCGENILPSNVTTCTDQLSIEFQTDRITTYTGFEAGYIACFDKKNATNRTEEFHFPMYQIAKNMVCVLDVQSIERQRIQLNMTIFSNTNGKECKDIIEIEGIDAADASLTGCAINRAFALTGSVSSHLRLVFTSKSRHEFVNGSYSIGELHDCSISGSGISPGENRCTDNSEYITPEAKNLNKTIIIIAAVVSASAVAIFMAVFFIIRRRNNSTADKEKILIEVQNEDAETNHTADKEGDIYVGNDEYDIARVNRNYKPAPNERENIYGGTFGSAAEYAVVYRVQAKQKNQPSSMYGDDRCDNVIDPGKSNAIYGMTSSPKLCGENILPPNVTTVTDELMLEFQTDRINTLTGFEAGYVACFQKKYDSRKREEFQFPIYQLSETMRCFLDIHLMERQIIFINMTIFSNENERQCRDIIKIVSDGIDSTETILEECTLNRTLPFYLLLSGHLRIIFTSESRNEYVAGAYALEKLKDLTTISKSKNNDQRSLSKNTNAVSIVVPVTTLLILAVICIIVVIMYRRGVIPVKPPWQSSRTYQDAVQYTSDDQYSVPSSPQGQKGTNNGAYQNEKFGKGSSASFGQNYCNVDEKDIRGTNTEATYETTEQQYKDHLGQNKLDNEHPYSDLNV